MIRKLSYDSMLDAITDLTDLTDLTDSVDTFGSVQFPTGWAWVALGSNLGDRLMFLCQGLNALCKHLNLDAAARCNPSDWRCSSIYQTPPHQASGGAYLNAVCGFPLPPEQRELPFALDYLSQLLKIEQELGRVRDSFETPQTSIKSNQARTLDLDLLWYGGLFCETPDLSLPHPRMCERSFVIEPLCELQAWDSLAAEMQTRSGDLSSLFALSLREQAQPKAIERYAKGGDWQAHLSDPAKC